MRFKGNNLHTPNEEWKAVKNSTYKRRFKQRGLGFHALNAPFEGCEGHHINFSDVIFVPKEMHRRMYHDLSTGKNMRAMNALAERYLKYGYRN